MNLTPYHAKYLAHELTRRCASDSVDKLTAVLSDAQVDLNPHQIEAALFAFRNPLSRGAILADEVGLGKTIEAGLLIAQKWAELFTDKLDELAVHEPVFGELRNVMDVCVMAALIQSRNLDEMAHCDLGVLRGQQKTIPQSELAAPSELEPQCSFLKTNGGWVVTASGGVIVDSWSVVSKTSENKTLSAVRDQAKAKKNGWSWN